MVLQGSFSSWRKTGRAAAEASAGREKRRTWQAVSGSVGLVASWSWRGGREGKETERTRRRLAFYFSFFLLCLKTSGAVTSVLFPFWFFTSAVRELKNKKKESNSWFYFFDSLHWLSAGALYSNWSWCAVCLMAEETSVWLSAALVESQSAKRRKKEIALRFDSLHLWPEDLRTERILYYYSFLLIPFYSIHLTISTYI
jgi:hypothetical protein